MGAEFRQALSARGLAWAVGIPAPSRSTHATSNSSFPIAPRGRLLQTPMCPMSSPQRSRHAHPSEMAHARLAQRNQGTLESLGFAAVRVRVADGQPQADRRQGHAAYAAATKSLLVGERRASGEQKYYSPTCRRKPFLKTLAATIKARWVCEQAHQQLKEERCRSTCNEFRHREVSLHRAYGLLADDRLRLPPASSPRRPERGKKSPGRPASADAAGHTKSRRRRPGPRSALPMPTLPQASPHTAQLKLPK